MKIPITSNGLPGIRYILFWMKRFLVQSGENGDSSKCVIVTLYTQIVITDVVITALNNKIINQDQSRISIHILDLSFIDLRRK